MQNVWDKEYINFEAFLRKCVIEFTSSVSVFKNAIICTI